ncbi:Ail/Lom family outer membrane beta-barrel protein [Escherichia coli]|uniref:Ail/Lom family outer membrane beta-barrel protein n=1 Tax=Escherichia coli TaxID=562 RepID=UPI0019D2239B|nr:Ail/Lom family outer membrane beta-barrel protein [Escherichia coli]EJQ0321525.1 Ail/Lom family outer membrane beta-barrel protein [Escherichia coli]MBN6398454.1 Ail/Lom family outer membrane beta-barrel protein [Escherichia coli]
MRKVCAVIVSVVAVWLAVFCVPAWASENHSTLSSGYFHARARVPGSGDLNGINVKYRYEFTDCLGGMLSLSYASAKKSHTVMTGENEVSRERWFHDESLHGSYVSAMAGPVLRISKQISAYAIAGVVHSRWKNSVRDYRTEEIQPGYTKETTTASDGSVAQHTSLAWGAGVQFNPTESVAIDLAYEGSGSGDWRTDGFIVGMGYKF